MLERRRTPRHQLGRVAAIMCGSGAERSCLVKDFSDGGVRPQTNGLEIPDEFGLLFSPNEPAQSGCYKDGSEDKQERSKTGLLLASDRTPEGEWEKFERWVWRRPRERSHVLFAHQPCITMSLPSVHCA
jgi:hypothetical protein